MKILVGTDIEEISRFDKLILKQSFLKGVFTQSEQKYICDKVAKSQTMAGIYCAKEAFAKATGEGLFGLKPLEIEVLHNEQGAPFIKLADALNARFDSARISLSISHCKSCAVATCIIFIE